jgi:hypothetical protein
MCEQQYKFPQKTKYEFVSSSCDAVEVKVVAFTIIIVALLSVFDATVIRQSHVPVPGFICGFIVVL